MKQKLLLFLLLCCQMGLAQKKLKMDITKNGDTLYSTSEKKIYVEAGRNKAVGEYLKTSVYRSANGFRLCLSIQTGRSNVLTIDEGATATINLSDGEKIVLSNLNYSKSRQSSMGYGCFLFAFYRLNATQIKTLKTTGISSIRVSSSAGPLDYDIKEKFAMEVGEQLEKF